MRVFTVLVLHVETQLSGGQCHQHGGGNINVSTVVGTTNDHISLARTRRTEQKS